MRAGRAKGRKFGAWRKTIADPLLLPQIVIWRPFFLWRGQPHYLSAPGPSDPTANKQIPLCRRYSGVARYPKRGCRWMSCGDLPERNIRPAEDDRAGSTG